MKLALGITALLSTTAIAAPLSHFDAQSVSLDAFLSDTVQFNSARTVRQSFVAGFAEINFIELNVQAVDSSIDRSFTLKILDAESQVIYEGRGSANHKNCTSWDCTLNPNSHFGKRVQLSPTVNLTPGQSYTFEVTSDFPLNLGFCESDSYTQGELAVDGALHSNKDLWFKTGWERNYRETSIGDFHFTGVITDVATIGHTSTPAELTVGTRAEGTITVLPEAFLAATEEGVSAYIAKHAMRSEIRLLNDESGGFEDGRDDNSLFIFDGGVVGLANDLASAGSENYDLFTAFFDRETADSWLVGQQYNELRLVLRDFEGTAIQEPYSHETFSVDAFGDRSLVMMLVDDATPNSQDSETLNKAYIVTINIDELVDISELNLISKFYAITENDQVTLNPWSTGQSEHKVDWFNFVFHVGSGSPFELSFWEPSTHQIRRRISQGPYAKTNIRTISSSTDGNNRLHPINFVQLTDTNGDGSIDEYNYRPQSISLYQSDEGSTLAQFLVQQQSFDGNAYLHIDVENLSENTTGLDVWVTYDTVASNLEDTEEYAWYRLGEFSAEEILASSGNLLIDGASLAYLTTPEVNIILSPQGGTKSTPLQLKGASFYKFNPLLTLEPEFISPSSSSSSSDANNSISSESESSSLAISSSSTSSSSSSLAFSSFESSSITSTTSSTAFSSSLTFSSNSSSSVIASSSNESGHSSSSGNQSSIEPSSSSLSSSVQSSASSISSSKPAECNAVINSSWNSGLTATVTIYNKSPTVLDGWELTIEFIDGGSINNLWNANIIENSGQVLTVNNLSWNSQIQPGQSVQFGFVANKNDGNGLMAITSNLCQ